MMGEIFQEPDLNEVSHVFGTPEVLTCLWYSKKIVLWDIYV